jgi:acyl carrier protein
MPNTDAVTLENELKEIVAKIVEVDPEKITPEARFVEDLGMDSMMALEILAAIEKRYKIQVPEDKIGKISNLAGVVSLTREYLS